MAQKPNSDTDSFLRRTGGAIKGALRGPGDRCEKCGVLRDRPHRKGCPYYKSK